MNTHKSSIVLAGVFAWFLTAGISFGHSTFAFVNYAGDGALDAPVFNWNGERLAGTNYVAMLYGGPTADAVAPAYRDGAGFQIMLPAPFTDRLDLGGGYFCGSTVVLYNVGAGGVAWLQVRAWDARLGATYEDVVSLGIGGYGESNLFQEQGGDPDAGVPTPPGFLLGLQSFSLIPEPSAPALVLLGFGLLLRRHRR